MYNKVLIVGAVCMASQACAPDGGLNNSSREKKTIKALKEKIAILEKENGNQGEKIKRLKDQLVLLQRARGARIAASPPPGGGAISADEDFSHTRGGIAPSTSTHESQREHSKMSGDRIQHMVGQQPEHENFSPSFGNNKIPSSMSAGYDSNGILNGGLTKDRNFPQFDPLTLGTNTTQSSKEHSKMNGNRIQHMVGQQPEHENFSPSFGSNSIPNEMLNRHDSNNTPNEMLNRHDSNSIPNEMLAGHRNPLRFGAPTLGISMPGNRGGTFRKKQENGLTSMVGQRFNYEDFIPSDGNSSLLPSTAGELHQNKFDVMGGRPYKPRVYGRRGGMPGKEWPTTEPRPPSFSTEDAVNDRGERESVDIEAQSRNSDQTEPELAFYEKGMSKVPMSNKSKFIEQSHGIPRRHHPPRHVLNDMLRQLNAPPKNDTTGSNRISPS